MGALVSACASEPGAPAGGDDTTADDEIRVVAKCERDFGAPLRKKVELAKDELRRTDAAFAKRVLAALDDGSVKVFPFCQMAPQHFEHFRADTDLSAFGATPEEQWRRLRDVFGWGIDIFDDITDTALDAAFCDDETRRRVRSAVTAARGARPS